MQHHYIGPTIGGKYKPKRVIMSTSEQFTVNKEGKQYTYKWSEHLGAFFLVCIKHPKK